MSKYLIVGTLKTDRDLTKDEQELLAWHMLVQVCEPRDEEGNDTDFETMEQDVRIVEIDG